MFVFLLVVCFSFYFDCLCVCCCLFVCLLVCRLFLLFFVLLMCLFVLRFRFCLVVFRLFVVWLFELCLFVCFVFVRFVVLASREGLGKPPGRGLGSLKMHLIRPLRA